MTDSLSADMRTVKEQMLAPLLEQPDIHRAGRLRASLLPDGSWPDVDYADQDRAVWKTPRHLGNLLILSRAYKASTSDLRDDSDLRRAIFSALDYWLGHDFTNPNWWYNQIGVPGTLSQILLLLDEELSSDQRQKGLEILSRAELSMTGQNLVWVADISARRGLLENDPDLVDASFQRIAAEIRMTMEEGIQPDYSFHQHGACLYSHGYGAGFASDCSRIAALLADTRFAFADERIDLLSRLILDGHQWFTRGIYQDFGAIGREISRSNHTARYLRRVVDNMLALPSGRKEEFDGLAARLRDEDAPPLVGNRHFWRADIMTHHRPSYYASARMHTDRLFNTDLPCNEEGLKSHHIADGATCILRSGREYHDIYPVWDWQRIPGTTVELTPGLVGEVRRRGSTSFGGGVSDGRYGLAAFDFERDGLTARKFWAFFDDEFVCLGTGISSSSENLIVTTVNQCHLQGEVAASTGMLPSGRHVLENPAWVHHDGVAYLFPEPAAIHLHNETRRGSWWEINHSASKEEIARDLFTLWIDHGAGSQNGTYAYIVAPDMPLSALEKGRTPPITILANSPDLQAAHHSELGIIGVVFYRPGDLEIEPGWKIGVDKPCLLLMRRTEEELTLSLSNPENRQLDVVVEISQRLAGDDVEGTDGNSQVRFVLPDGMHAGQSVSRTWRVRN